MCYSTCRYTVAMAWLPDDAIEYHYTYTNSTAKPLAAMLNLQSPQNLVIA